MRGILRRVFGQSFRLILIISLLANSTPAAPMVLSSAVSQWQSALSLWLYATGWPMLSKRLSTLQGNGNSQRQEKQADRDARVHHLRIHPGNVTLQLYEHVVLAAVAYDQDGAPIGGVRIIWSALDEGRNNEQARISQRGEFVATFPGTYRVRAEGGGKQAHIKITVQDGAPRRRNEQPSGSSDVSSREYSATSASISQRKGGERRATRDAHPPRFVKTSFAHAAALKTPTATMAAVQLDCGDEYRWNRCNRGAADDPDNERGNRPGQPLDLGAGSGNFQVTAPALALPGRGIDISLGLAYNARVWAKAGTKINYDIDQDWPAPGWSLGFGKMIGMGSGQGGMIMDADGTRHGYYGTSTTYSWGSTFAGYTTDGTFIDYSTQADTAGTLNYAQAKYPNGTLIQYGAAGAGSMYPTQITDANGNYITITYVNNTGPRIQTVTDTLGRAISFYYDANNLLTTITGPGLSGGTRMLVRLTYRQVPITPSFAGLTAMVRNANPWLVSAIYYPATNTGYWFGDADSYLASGGVSYGMLAKVVEQRSMSFTMGAAYSDQGTIMPGVMSKQQVYGFQTLTNLSDAPTFTSLTESWDGMTSPAPVTNFDVHQDATPRTVTVTLPNGVKSTQTSYNYSNLAATDPLKALDGVIYQDQTTDASGTIVLQSSATTWEIGDYKSPRPQNVRTTDEKNRTTGTEFDYTISPSYNQVREARHYDYGYAPGAVNTLLRKTTTQYETVAGYINRHIFNLPTVVEIYDANNTRMSRTEYQHDGASAPSAPSGAASLLNLPTTASMHDEAYNPFAPRVWNPPYCYYDCDYPTPPYCRQTCDPGYYSTAYDSSTDYRGNVTKVTTYADAVNLGGAIIETRQYDITGNLVKANTSCCQQTSFNYTSDTQYAYPLSQKRGSATDAAAQITTSATYDFNTGLVLTATDANGRTTGTNYYQDTLRLQTVTLPTGARTDYIYDDGAMSINATTYLAPSAPDNGAIADQSVKLLNGLGQVALEKALGANGAWDVVETKYDALNRVSQQSRPYRSGVEQPQWSTTNYDPLGRTSSVQAPDSSTTQVFYNEDARPNTASSAPGQTVRVVDAWGRERWGRNDADGRLVEVVEPNPNGSGSIFDPGSLATQYIYDTLGRLTGVTQGAQQRSFKYDSLGRLIAQKLAESGAMLNDAGQYVAGGGQWGDVFSYDDRSNLTARVDARGVKTKYNYNDDPLNRLQSVEYDTSGFGDAGHPIVAAPTTTYSYMTSGDVARLNMVTTAGVSTETYIYGDAEQRLTRQSVTISGRPALDTDYIYDSLDRVVNVVYPAQYGVLGNPRKTVHHDYDVAGRLNGLKVDNVDYASQINYNAASQTTSLKVGAIGVNQLTENYSYDPLTGLLNGQTLMRATAALLDLSYDYANASGKRTGQLTRLLNNRDHNKDRSYSYDMLGRLSQVTGGSSLLWAENYSYDRYGNRTGVISTGNTAQLNLPTEPKLRMPTDQLAWSVSPRLPAEMRNDSARARTVSDAPDAPRLFGRPANNFLAGAALLAAPSSLTVMATSNTQINLSWTPPAGGVDHYQIERSQSISGPYSVIGAPTATNFTDAGVSANTAYLYRVRAADANNIYSAYSNGAMGTSIAFTDAPLIAGVTIVKAQHVIELRQAVNAVRRAADLSDATWTDATLPAAPIRAAHVQELRDRLNEALAALNIPRTPFTDPDLATGAGGTTIKRTHFEELRQRASRGSGTGSAGPPPVGANDTVWVEDVLPAGAQTTSGALSGNGATWMNEAWNWISGNPAPFSGNVAAQSGLTAGIHQMYFENATNTLTLVSGDKLVAYVYLDPGNAPSEIMLQWNDGATWDHRAYWGANQVPWGVDGTASRRYVGPLPTAGQWVRLEVFADQVGLVGRTVSGLGLTLYNGRAVWDHIGKVPAAVGGGGTPVPRDGTSALGYDAATNRINTPGYEYDAAGNQTRVASGTGGWQRHQYDAANRLVKVTDDANLIISTTTYGSSNQRLLIEEGGARTYYAWGGEAVVAEYIEYGAATVPQWTKSYIYLGARLLATLTPGTGSEFVQFQHPDRLGTRLVTNATDTSQAQEQVSLPFGTALEAESSGATNRRFTSYDRSGATGLDYAVNRHYSSAQGRFTQADPIGMSAASLANPQSLNLYAYCGNDPINHTDPDGLFWGKLWRGIKKILSNKWVAIAITVALAVITYGASGGVSAWWQLSKPILESLGNLGYGEAFLTVGHTATALGWVAAGLSAALAIPTIGSIQSIWQNALSLGIGKVLGSFGAVSGDGTGGTPGFNPNSGLGIGNSFTCCEDAADAVVTLGAGYADTITWGAGPWLRKKLAGALGGPRAEELQAKDNERMASSWWYTAGEAAGVAWDLATGEQVAEVGARALGYGGRIALDAAHHTFGRFGKLSHLQLNLYKVGVKGSARAYRIPLPLRRFPKRNIYRRF